MFRLDLVFLLLSASRLRQCTGIRTSLTGSFFGVPGVNATFDYVVVGGGTSGLTVAKRLAETEGVSVGVIEAGGFYEIDNGNLSQIPAYAIRGQGDTAADILPGVDWGFFTLPQPALDGRELFYAQGRTLGGGSARNLMAYQRGTKGTFEKWADQVGDDTFTFTSLLPYFEKSPYFTAPNYSKLVPPVENITYDPAVFSPTGGPLQVSYSNYRQPFTRFLTRAMEAIGLTSIPGFNSGELIGFGFNTFTLNPADETRSSSQTSFLQSAIEGQEAVQVYTRTSAKRIIIDRNKKATGVLVSTNGYGYSLSASKEVILACGVFKSPQLLMVSGIGPAPTLANLNIPVISDLSGVGQNMWDHPLFGIQYRVNVTTAQALGNAAYLAQAETKYLDDQSGPLTSVGGDIIGWSKVPAKYRGDLSNTSLSDLSQFPSDWPELEILPIAGALAPVNDTFNYASFTIGVIAPISRGNVSINSTNTDDPPLISPNWLESRTDQEVAVQGFKLARDLAEASDITVGAENAPGNEVQTDDEILAFLRQTITTWHHASATCAMGNTSDPMAVVSTTGKVHGVHSLRIIDASTFPLLPPGHPQSIVYALAEKYADDIKNGR